MVATIMFALAGLLSFAAAESVSVTPHDQYSSSEGVLGCKIDTNRVAYLPRRIGCDNLCYKFTYGTGPDKRELTLLHIDTSIGPSGTPADGAWDISYDAWNFLTTGKSAKEKPTAGGGMPMDATVVSMDQCKGVIKTDDGKLGFIATNANIVNTCSKSSPGSWIAKNYQLFNFKNSCCNLGEDRKCSYDDAALGTGLKCDGGVQAGAVGTPFTTPAKNIMYQTGLETPCV